MVRNRHCTLAVAAIVAALTFCCQLLADDAPGSPPPKKPSPKEVIRQALAKPVELKYDKVPLNEVAKDLEAKLGVPVRLDAKVLRDVGIATDTPVTFAVSNIAAKSAIALMLRKYGLARIVRYEVLLISTPEEEESLLETRVYDVADLVCRPGASDPRKPELEQLVNVIKAIDRPVVWDEAVGPLPRSQRPEST